MEITKLLKAGLFIGLFTLMLSCDRPKCGNTNPIFDRYTPETKEYKEELARLLEMNKNNELSYWFDRYEPKNNKEYILVYIQGGELCAKGLILVDNWGKLEGVKRAQGLGYGGAELRGLQIDIRKDSQEIELVLKDIDYIID